MADEKLPDQPPQEVPKEERIAPEVAGAAARVLAEKGDREGAIRVLQNVMGGDRDRAERLLDVGLEAARRKQAAKKSGCAGVLAAILVAAVAVALIG